MGRLCTGPQVGSQVSPWEPSKDNAQFAVALSCCCGCKPSWLSRLDVLRVHLSGAGLKSCGARCGVWTCHSSWRSSRLWVPLFLWVTELGVSSCKIVSQPLPPILMWGFFLCPMCRSHSASFGVSFRGYYFVCSCRFSVSVRGGGFILNPNLHGLFIACFWHATICYRHFSCW